MRTLVFVALMGLAVTEEACGSEDQIDASSLIQSSQLRVQQRSVAQMDIKEIAADKESRRAYLNNLLQSTKDLMKAGVTPDVVTFVQATMAAIRDEVLPIILREHNADQAMLVALWTHFTKAEDDLVTALANAQPSIDNHDLAVTVHTDCRVIESELCMDANNCDAELAQLWVDVVQLEAIISNIDDVIYTYWCEDNHNRTLTEFRTSTVTTFNSYITTKEDLDAAWALYLPKLSECQRLRAEHHAQVTVCDTNQGDMEVATCLTGVTMDAIRTAYAAAFAQAVASYEPTADLIRVEESDRKVEFSTLQMVLCLLDNIDEMINGSATAAGTDFAAHLEACQEEIFDTAHLDILYNDTPDPTPIPDVAIHIPCTEEFIVSAYGDMPFCTEHTGCQICAAFADEQ